MPDCPPTVADLVYPIPASSETESVQFKVITPPKQVQNPVLRVGWEDTGTLPTPLTCGWLQEDHVLQERVVGTIPFQRCRAQVGRQMRGREEGEALRQTGQGQALHLLLACCSLQDKGRAQKGWDKDPSQSCSETHSPVLLSRSDPIHHPSSGSNPTHH